MPICQFFKNFLKTLIGAANLRCRRVSFYQILSGKTDALRAIRTASILCRSRGAWGGKALGEPLGA
ncbi:MAG: hypothetical protein PHO46_05180 [Thermoguttaceae bacterium]|jgi:hypothetical protein|nr:hypothetical protein [Thermoguttaceae bacterium]